MSKLKKIIPQSHFLSEGTTGSPWIQRENCGIPKWQSLWEPFKQSDVAVAHVSINRDQGKAGDGFADPLLRLPVRGIQKDVENPWGFTRSQIIVGDQPP